MTENTKPSPAGGVDVAELVERLRKRTGFNHLNGIIATCNKAASALAAQAERIAELERDALINAENLAVLAKELATRAGKEE